MNNSGYIMVAENNNPNVDYLITELSKHHIRFFGAIFPGVIYGEHKFDTGAVITSLQLLSEPKLIEGMKEEINLSAAYFHSVKAYETKPTAFILVDGLAENISSFIDQVYGMLGNTVQYIGGGAGSLSLKKQPCLFNKHGIFEDAAFIALIKQSCSLGVKHGWKSVDGPYIATKTIKNKVVDLNWDNAFSIYKEVVKRDHNIDLTKENFFHYAKGYPFGIMKEKLEPIVRDPISILDDGTMICVGEVPENSVLEILKGEPSELIKAAGEAAQQSIDHLNGRAKQCLVVDCISRVLFLEDEFHSELENVKKTLDKGLINEVPIVGMLTLGEISSYGTGLLEFFNKTIVVGVIYEE